MALRRAGGLRIAVIGGGIAGLAAAWRLEALLPDADIVLIEREPRVGGKLVTERIDGFVVEGAADSLLSRKERGVGLCEELGLGHELVGRRPENARSFVRRGDELHPLPEGLTGMIPTDIDALETSALLSPEGRKRLAEEVDIPPAPAGGDESIASFFIRRLGYEAYDALVEPLVTGIYGGDGYLLSLRATFPDLRALELEHGSVIRGLRARSAEDASNRAPFVTLRPGMDRLVSRLDEKLERTEIRTDLVAHAMRPGAGSGFTIALDHGEMLEADGVVVAVPAFAAALLLGEIGEGLSAAHAEIPYASSAVVTLAYVDHAIGHPLDGYGYVVPQSEGSDVLACSWSSSKWEGRAPASRSARRSHQSKSLQRLGWTVLESGYVLIRVFVGRFGGRDVTALSDDELLGLARDELRFLEIEPEPELEIDAEPERTWIHRWPRGMPQYVMGHLERVERIDAALESHPGLAVAGAAYRGVGIPDCIRSGEEAAESVVRSLAAAVP